MSKPVQYPRVRVTNLGNYIVEIDVVTVRCFTESLTDISSNVSSWGLIKGKAMRSDAKLYDTLVNLARASRPTTTQTTVPTKHEFKIGDVVRRNSVPDVTGTSSQDSRFTQGRDYMVKKVRRDSNKRGPIITLSADDGIDIPVWSDSFDYMYTIPQNIPTPTTKTAMCPFTVGQVVTRNSLKDMCRGVDYHFTQGNMYEITEISGTHSIKDGWHLKMKGDNRTPYNVGSDGFEPILVGTTPTNTTSSNVAQGTPNAKPEFKVGDRVVRNSVKNIDGSSHQDNSFVKSKYYEVLGVSSRGGLRGDAIYLISDTGDRIAVWSDGFEHFVEPQEPEEPEEVEEEQKEFVPRYKLGNKVLLFGPTGTGKTYNFHETAEFYKAKGEIEIIEKVTVTEGFEDQDFLAYIIPTANGVKFQERDIIKSLREASQGKKMALCIDELNRGSRSFMNFMLTFLDGVDADHYVLNNFMFDEKITIPVENLLIFATINLGGKYTGTNSMDEALKDRFQFVQYVTYNLPLEKALIDTAFGEYAEQIIKVIKDVRELSTSGGISSSISTRGVKTWCEHYLESKKTKKAIFETFTDTLLFRLAGVDAQGNPNSTEILPIQAKFRDNKII